MSNPDPGRRVVGASRYLTRDRVALLAALAAPLALAAILEPFRASFPNTDAALALLLVVVAVAANGSRLAAFPPAVSLAASCHLLPTPPSPPSPLPRPPASPPHRP